MYTILLLIFFRNSRVQSIDMTETRRYCWHLADTIGAYRTSTSIDLLNGSPMEIEYIFGKALDIAMQLGSKENVLDKEGGKEGLRWPNSCQYTHIENIVRTVFAVSRISQQRKQRNQIMKLARTDG